MWTRQYYRTQFERNYIANWSRDKKTTSVSSAAPSHCDGWRSELVEFFRNFTLHCYRWLVEPQISGWQRFVWLVVHLIGIAAVVLVLTTAYNIYNISVTVTTLYTTLYPIQSVPFPAISICNNNRIGRNAAIAYAESLASIDPNFTNPEYFLDKIREFGRLLDNDLDTRADLMGFQEFLDSIDPNEVFDMTGHMHQLSPKCADLLLRCIWRGVEHRCLEDAEMFEMRRTQYGFCCTFNYVRPEMLNQQEPPSQYIDDTGPERGLILLLNGTAHDYFYPLYNFVGFVVQVFNPNEYPDVPSGSVSERLVGLGYESFIRIDSSTLFSDTDIRRYSAESRGCLFSDELEQDFGGRYKRSDCVVNCRIASILALCNCKMYHLPVANILLTQNRPGRKAVPTCTLEHLACLNRYRVKWSTLLLKLDKIAGLEREQEDGLYCPECLPSCSATVYKVSSQELPLLLTKRKYPTILSDIENISEIAVVRIFLGSPETWLYQQSVATKWYEIVSNLGGTCGVISGFSLISVAEVLYFVGKLLVRKCRRLVRCDMSPRNSQTGISEADTILYIMP